MPRRGRSSPSEGGDDAPRHGTPCDAEIGSEAPIRTSRQDRLRRVDFADRIATVLSEVSLAEGRVFAIRGGWGYGKSSLKHLVMERLDARESGGSWLDFNPWQWGDSDAIARALFGEIANKLGGDFSTDAADRAAKFRAYGAILTGVAEPLAKAGDQHPLLASFLTSASVVAVAAAVGFSLPDVAMVAACVALFAFILQLTGRLLAHLGQDKTAEPLDVIRQSLEESLKKLPRPLIIFVDDIDRLEPEQIRLLLRQVKANANLPNLVFVLIFQPSVVETALDPIAGGNGAAFLEKIVQTNFDLPSVPVATVHRIFAEQLADIAGIYANEGNGFYEVRWGNCLYDCIHPYIRNLRDARRLLSSVAVHLPLHAGSDTLEVNLIDFLVLESLRVFEPELHDLLFREQDLVLQTDRLPGDGRNEAEKSRIEILLNAADKKNRHTAKRALKELFPQIGWAFDGMHYGSQSYQKWLSDKRVCTKRYFPRYFELQTPEGDISESEFSCLLAASSNVNQLTDAVGEIESRGLLSALAQRLDESVDRLPAAQAANLLPVMFNLGQKLAHEEGSGPFDSPYVSAWRAIHWFLARVSAQDRGALAIESLRKTGALAIAAILIHLSDPDARKEDQSNFTPVLDSNTITMMKAEWLRQVAILANAQDKLLDQPGLINLLYRWRDYSGSMEAPRKWVEEAIKTDSGFAKFVMRMMSRSVSWGMGDRVSKAVDNFEQRTVEHFIGIQATRERIEAIDADMLNPAEAHALRTLRQHLESWDKGAAENSAG